MEVWYVSPGCWVAGGGGTATSFLNLRGDLEK